MYNNLHNLDNIKLTLKMFRDFFTMISLIGVASFFVKLLSISFGTSFVAVFCGSYLYAMILVFISRFVISRPMRDIIFNDDAEYKKYLAKEREMKKHQDRRKVYKYFNLFIQTAFEVILVTMCVLKITCSILWK